jgi:hypothetical protein
MNIAKMINPPIQSVLKQNTEAKLWGNPGEWSQCVSAMGRSEEASFRGQAGWRLGRVRGRASPRWAKSVVSASKRRLPVIVCADSDGQIDQVGYASTSGTWLDHITGEVPRCLPPPAGVKNGYKYAMKGQPDASVAGTVSYRPRLQGCQQRQSTSVWRKERQNRKQPVQAPVTRIVSQATPAAKWPAGTSSRQLASTLRNIPTGTAAAPDRPSTTS